MPLRRSGKHLLELRSINITFLRDELPKLMSKMNSRDLHLDLVTNFFNQLMLESIDLCF